MQRLPTELLGIIISFLVESDPTQRQDTLLAVSLVSHRLQEIARPHLFRTVHVKCKYYGNTVQDFREFLHIHPRIHDHVQELRLLGNVHKWDHCLDPTVLSISLLKDILNHLHKLQSLVVSRMNVELRMGEPLECGLWARIRTLLLRTVQVSAEDFLHMLSLFSQIQSLELSDVLLWPASDNQYGALECKDSHRLHAASTSHIGHVRLSTEYPYSSLLQMLVNPILGPIHSCAFVCIKQGQLRSVATFLSQTGRDVTRLSLDLCLLPMNGRGNYEPDGSLPDVIIALKHSFELCTELAHLHLSLCMSCACQENTQGDQTIFRMMMDLIGCLPRGKLRSLTLELASAQNVPCPHSAHLWMCVEDEGWAKLREVYDRFENLESVELLDDGAQYRAGQAAHQAKDVRARQEAFGLPLTPSLNALSG
ncbi:hypothetical protein BDW22DRAFT_1430866 [Trametopsis cervina]|nr:hypothetical protein BDW22DRAFT_1430866 [Trametopsis cervina]